MRFALLVLLAALAAPAGAQVPPRSPDGGGPGTRLPVPEVDENAAPAAFLDAARGAIAAGRVPEAMEALERAESRVLARSVRPSMASQPSRQPQIALIAAARGALAGGDRMQALQFIDQALAAGAQEPD